MKDETQILLVLIIIVGAVVVYIGCACLPSKAEFKEWFSKLKHKKEPFACPIMVYEKLHRIYPQIFYDFDDTTNKIKKILGRKTFNDFSNESECIKFICDYVDKNKSKLI